MAPDGDPTLPRLHSCDGSVSGTGSMPSSWRIWANFAGSASLRSAIIARSAVRPASVKNSLGRRCPVSSRINPRSSKLVTVGESFGLPASGPPRQVLSWKPSATLGSVEKKPSSSRRMYSRSRAVKVATATFCILLMRRMLARLAAQLESPGFAQNFGSCGEVEGLHLVGVLTFGDEFREDVGLVGIQ